MRAEAWGLCQAALRLAACVQEGTGRPVSAMALVGDRLWVGDLSGRLRIWTLQDPHTCPVCCLAELLLSWLGRVCGLAGFLMLLLICCWQAVILPR